MIWLQQTPQGDFAIAFWEVADPARAMQTLGASNNPHDRWFVEQIKQNHGIDLTQPPPGPPNMVYSEWQES